MTIRELRTQQKLSQAEFAGRIGVSQVTVSMIETGRIKVSPKVAAAVKKAYRVDIAGGDAGKPAGKKTARKEPAAKKKAEKKASKPATKETPAGAKVKATKAGKASGRKTELYIQSPLGGEIMPEQVRAKIPADADACYVRVDQNTIWWIRGAEDGFVPIW